ncbi:OmpA family protein [Microvirga pakistanensis]|uniref:OmpA family protein n=1 Tax=Microvirga pakistanensis TaxID=1682650 RepID=UPI001FCE6D34|nr:OmpA family protein [Microvirga pakistanensis]
MKFANLLLASTAIPLMMLSANASALQPQTSAAITVAQADTGDQPPRVRPRPGGQDEDGAPGQQRRQGRPGAEDGGPQRPQRGGGAGADSPDQPRRPSAASPDSDAPTAPRPRQEQRTQEPRTQEPRQPAERAAPTRPSQAPAERARPQDETPARPARPTTQERDQQRDRQQGGDQQRDRQQGGDQQRDRQQGDRPRQQAPDTPARPSGEAPARSAPDSPTRPSTETPTRPSPDTPARPSTAPAPGQPRSTPSVPSPADRQQERDQRRGQDRDRTQTDPSARDPRTAPTAPATRTAPDAPAQTAPAPRAQPTAPAAPQQAAPRDARPLDASRVRIEDLRSQRRERREGDRVIIEEPGNRTIIREGNTVIIRHDESERFRRIYGSDEVRVERRAGNEEVTIVRRPDGSEIVSVRDEYGNLIRRVRREPAGREVVLIENRRSGIGSRPGYGYVEEEVLRLPPPVVRIPREQYIVETERASEADIVEAFTAPPVERVERSYTLDEIRRSQPLRERMRRVDLDTINFEFGSWELPPDQIDALRVIAEGLRQAISRSPNEIFLVEGHTDAVGADEDNLTLSDRRAETVATILTQQFQIPAENLTTQGYGEQYLKVNSQGPEAENRRVTLRRITPLLQGQNQQ